MPRRRRTRFTPPTLTAAGFWSSWRAEIKHIRQNVQELVTNDHVFRESMSILESRADTGGSGYQWLLAMYGRDAVVGIRRMMDRDWRSSSLLNLLRSIEANNRVITLERFTRPYLRYRHDRAGWRRTAAREFASLVGTSHRFLPKQLVRDDRRELERRWRTIQRVANKRIAHFSPASSVRRTPLWRDIHDMISAMEQITIRYIWLLHQADWSRGLMPSEYRTTGDFHRELIAFWGR